MANTTSGQINPGRGVSWRAIILALILIPFNALWVQSMELLWDTGWPDAVSLLFNTIFILLFLALGNLVLRRWLPQWALEPGELVVVYVMLCLSTVICGHDFLQVLVIMLISPSYYATPENQWEDLFLRRLPPSLIVNDQGAANSFWEGGAYLYSWSALRPWVVPAAMWIGFTIVLLGVMMCINIVVWRRWNDQERLTYPLLQLPLHLTKPGFQLLGRDLLGNKLLWIGFVATGAIDLLNGLAHLYPRLPSLHVTHTVVTPTTYPWLAMGWTAVAIYPFAIGLGYMMPQDFLFSCWFFYWLWKAEMIVGYLIGAVQATAFPYVDEQTFGAYAGIGIFALWTGRHYFGRVIGDLLRGSSSSHDRPQALLHQIGFGGMIVGLFILIIFATNVMGIGLPAALLFLGGYLLIAFSITRMRAEFGLPVHDFWTSPLQIAVNIAGGRAFGARNLTALSPLLWLVRSQRSQPMPHGLEGLTLGERRGLAGLSVLGALSLAIIVGTIAGFWSMLHLGYRHGFTLNPMTDATYLATGHIFQRAAGWLTLPPPVHLERLAGLLVGVLFSIGLLLMRQRFVWWPFHPAGYAASSMTFMGLLWLPMMVAWAVKVLVLRYGSHKLYRRLLPLFLGLILGEFVMGGVWGLVGVIGTFDTYRFWPY